MFPIFRKELSVSFSNQKITSNTANFIRFKVSSILIYKLCIKSMIKVVKIVEEEERCKKMGVTGRNIERGGRKSKSGVHKGILTITFGEGYFVWWFSKEGYFIKFSVDCYLVLKSWNLKVFFNMTVELKVIIRWIWWSIQVMRWGGVFFFFF